MSALLASITAQAVEPRLDRATVLRSRASGLATFGAGDLTLQGWRGAALCLALGVLAVPGRGDNTLLESFRCEAPEATLLHCAAVGNSGNTLECLEDSGQQHALDTSTGIHWKDLPHSCSSYAAHCSAIPCW